MSVSILREGQMALVGVAKGFTLLELLVAIVILSLGLLGAASLQVVSTRSNFEAIQRSQATILANAVVDRMRTNSEVLDCYAATDLGYGINVASCNVSGKTNLIAIANQDRAELDLMADRSDALIEPIICITNNYLGGGNGNIRVVVAWRGASKNVGDSVQDPECVGIIDPGFLKQVVLDSYITPFNPE